MQIVCACYIIPCHVFGVDADNKFVGVSITMSESRIKINCTFFDQPKETVKSCAARYGPSCRDLSLLPTKASVVNSNSVVIETNYMQNISNDITVCFGIIASNVTNTVNLEGFYSDSGEYPCMKYQWQ